MKQLKIKIRHLVLAGIILLSLNLHAQRSNFYIFICFGQSNMEGQGTIEEQDLQASDRFMLLQALDCPNLNRTKGAWYQAVPPTCQCYSKLSPADYFGRTMIANLPDSISVGVINVSVGGCDIRLFDRDIYQEYDSTYTDNWFTSKVANYGGNPYRHLVDLARLAQNDGVIKGILLHQGETNTGQTEWLSYVKKIYKNLLEDLSLEADSVPLLAGQLLSEGKNCCSSMNAIIDQLPDSIPTAHVISSKGCAGQDNAHFNAEGYRILGTRYAQTMLQVLGFSEK